MFFGASNMYNMNNIDSQNDEVFFVSVFDL